MAGWRGVVYLFISLATNQKLPSTQTPACLSISALGRWVAARQKSQERIKQEGGTDVRAIGEGKEKKNPTQQHGDGMLERKRRASSHQRVWTGLW